MKKEMTQGLSGNFGDWMGIHRDIRKMLTVLFAALPLIGLIIVGCIARQGFITDRVTLVLSAGQYEQQLRLWDSKDGELYCFLPGSIPPEDIRFQIDKGIRLYLDDKPICSGMTLSELPIDRSGILRYETGLQKESFRLTILRGSGVASLYLDCRSGDMGRVHARKENSEKVNVLLCDENGAIYCSSDYSDKLSGHGNSTWNRDKKPYNLNLSQPADLLGGGEECRWILLANYNDKAHMCNEIFLSMARDTGNQWNPNAIYVDLYLNGIYAGLYQLTDRVEASENRVQLETEDLFFKFEITGRADSPFVEDIFPDISAEILSPSGVDSRKLRSMDSTLRELFSGLENHTIPEKRLSEYLDVESLAWQYLIQEISLDYDSGVASQYFLLRNGKLYGGPVWDFDITLGNWTYYSPQCLFSQQSVRTPLWRSLMAYDSFREYVYELYTSTFMPWLHTLMDSGFSQTAAKIKASSEMNLIRWHLAEIRSGTQLPVDSSVEEMYSFLEERVAFLDQVFQEQTQFHNVCIYAPGYVDGVYGYYTVEHGTNVGEFLEEAFSGVSYSIPDLTEADRAKSITEDLRFTAEVTAPDSEPEEPELNWKGKLVFWLTYHKEEALSYCSLVVFFLLLGIMFFMDKYRYKKGETDS